MKIIITGGKSAKSMKLLKAFEAAQVILADYGDVPSFTSPLYTFFSLGERNDEIIAHNLLNTCLDEEADTLLPLYDFEVEAIAKSILLFREYNINVLLPDAAVLPLYFKAPIPAVEGWAVIDEGKLIYSSLPWIPVFKEKVSGVFNYADIKDEIFTSLYTIS